MKSETPPIQIALSYAERGLAVFPCKPDKAPWTPNGFKDASRDQAVITAWWRQRPDALIGCPTSAENDIYVVDLDVDKKTGEAIGEKTARELGLLEALERAPQARTPSGGRHFYFQHPGAGFGRQIKVEPGVDLLGGGGYVILPGVGGYEWEAGSDAFPDALPTLPPEVKALADKRRKSQKTNARPRSGACPNQASEDYLPRVLKLLEEAPNDLSREDWVTLAHALKWEFGDSARDAFLAFSARYDGPIEPGEAERMWDSAEPDGSVKLGTVMYLLSGNAHGRACGARADSPDGAGKPRLLVDPTDPEVTIDAMTAILAASGELCDRGVPVQITHDQMKAGTVLRPITADALVLLVHRLARPYSVKVTEDGEVKERNARLPRTSAVMYLDSYGKWELPPLNGIASTPMLREDGSLYCADGYDPGSGMWCEGMPNVELLVPTSPTRAEAEGALGRLRGFFKTFCFADSLRTEDAETGLTVTDVTQPPGADEGAFLNALLTAVCRPSLHLAPGVVVKAASVSGAGAGKGLLARCMCLIAFGREPHAVTAGGSREELEKRISAELIEGGPTLFLDNLNNQASFKSDLLASAITERPSRVRILGKSQMALLNASAQVILTGNGLSVSEDLARRFLTIELDPGVEDPEARSFPGDIRQEALERRPELLAAALTIWRWGRQADFAAGRSLGSFEDWCRWVRDPLLALGCPDPALRVSEAKQRDTQRQSVADLFEAWDRHHGDALVAQADLHAEICSLLAPKNPSRQAISAALSRLDGTRLAGYVLTRHKSDAKWAAARYQLQRNDRHDASPSSAQAGANTVGGGEQTGPDSHGTGMNTFAEPENHRGHRGHRAETPAPDPYDPYDPYADPPAGKNDMHDGSGPDRRREEDAPAAAGWSMDL